jgi:hypothetical protein
LGHRVARLALTVAGFGAVVFGLLVNNLAARTEPDLFGVPTGALVGYLAGALVLRVLYAVPVT